MVHEDTISLLRECSAGIKMGTATIDGVLKSVDDKKLEEILSSSKDEHNRLGEETEKLLESCGRCEKEPGAMAKGMSWVKTNIMMAVDGGDHTIADLITDGCNMGIKSLSRYLNQYAAADEHSKDIAKKLISMEERLTVKMRDYL
ncbi:MAG: hypothetical protein PUH94_02830 [Firmicutes bacterium]|nr:hypothetical protein [Bacillota bacterium]MDY5770728.1 hypothetical protein [Anaerovoracaceae bacterium]